jgi:hypothetical protein
MVVESCRNFYFAIGKEEKSSNLQPCHKGKIMCRKNNMIGYKVMIGWVALNGRVIR